MELVEKTIGAPLPGEPGVAPLLDPIPLVPFGQNQPASEHPTTANLADGAVVANVQAPNLSLSGALNASWSLGRIPTSFQVSALNASGATVLDASGNTIGTGAVRLAAATLIPLAASGPWAYSISSRKPLRLRPGSEPARGRRRLDQ